jgi:hypothetical protein
MPWVFFTNSAHFVPQTPQLSASVCRFFCKYINQQQQQKQCTATVQPTIKQQSNWIKSMGTTRQTC